MHKSTFSSWLYKPYSRVSCHLTRKVNFPLCCGVVNIIKTRVQVAFYKTAELISQHYWRGKAWLYILQWSYLRQKRAVLAFKSKYTFLVMSRPSLTHHCGLPSGKLSLNDSNSYFPGSALHTSLVPWAHARTQSIYPEYFKSFIFHMILTRNRRNWQETNKQTNPSWNWHSMGRWYGVENSSRLSSHCHCSCDNWFSPPREVLPQLLLFAGCQI